MTTGDENAYARGNESDLSGWRAADRPTYSGSSGDDAPRIGRHSRKRNTPRWVLLCVTLVLVSSAASSAVTAYVLSGDDESVDVQALAQPEGAFDPAEVPDSEVLEACHEKVEERLRAPGSAQYSDESVANTGRGNYFAHGVVDSQNGFGALLRMAWTCDTKVLNSGAFVDFTVNVEDA